jgi:Family of unknown function (DUF5683)
MPVRPLYFFIVLFTCFAHTSLAQNPVDSTTGVKNDTLPGAIKKSVNAPESDTTSHKNVLALDSTAKRFDPKKATLRSLILPGWGQAYNKKYWKIPIVYGALGTTAGVFLYNRKTYQLLRKAVIYRLSGDTAQFALVDPQFQALTTASLQIYRNAFRQNIDYSVLVFLIFWGLNVVDATVDAHLKAFDVSSDIGLKLQPGFNTGSAAPGLSLVFFIKDKSAKTLLPLP